MFQRKSAVESTILQKVDGKNKFSQENDVVMNMANVGKNVTIQKNALKLIWKKIGLTKRIKRIIPKMRELWIEFDLTNRFKTLVAEIKYLFKTIDGMSVWAINHSFTRIALSREHLEEMMVNGNLVIQLAPKNKRELADGRKKKEIEEKIKELEGFAILRLCLLEDCQPIYKETLTEFGVSRWLEIPRKLS